MIMFTGNRYHRNIQEELYETRRINNPSIQDEYQHKINVAHREDREIKTQLWYSRLITDFVRGNIQ